jgi:hypothetical protein
MLKKIATIVFVTLIFFVQSLTAQDGLVGHWTFDNPSSLIEATIGSDLLLIGSHESVVGPDSGNGAVNIGVGNYYVVQHNMTPNGGGSRVNEFTLVMDIKVSQLGRWYTLYQVNPYNTDDGEWFIDTRGKMGVLATGYTEPLINIDKWYRLAITVKNGSRYDYYMDGKLVLKGQPSGIDDRFSFGTSVLLFADENEEDNPLDIAEIKIFSRALDDTEIESLGGFNYSEPNDPMEPVLSIDYSTDHEIVIVADSTAHADYGLSYPVTYQIEIPEGVSDLFVYKKHSEMKAWTAFTEKYSNDFFNGIEAVRFDYENKLAYISTAFCNETDSIFLKICDNTNRNLPIAYQGICEYYDDRDAVVTSSADDWADSGDRTWYQSDEAFQITCQQFRKYHLWISCGIITQYCNEMTWQHIQAELDSGYVEVCSHSRTHSYGPYENPGSEIAGSKQDIFDNLDLPASFKSGEKEYMYTWIAPANYYDEIVNTMVGDNKYLVNRRYNWPFDEFSDWNPNAGYYHTIGISREASPIWEGTTDLNDLNSYFEMVVAKKGIYHLMTHPYFLLENGLDAAGYAWTHLEYIGNRKNIWYVSVGHLYLYHYIQENAPLPTSVFFPETKPVKDMQLFQNYPNPFNSSTKMQYELPNSDYVHLGIYNQLGQHIRILVDRPQQPGSYCFNWDGKDEKNMPVAAGLYFCRLKTNDFFEVIKVVLVK